MTISEDAVLRLEQSRHKMLTAMSTSDAPSSAASLVLAAGTMMVQPTVKKHPLGTVLAAAMMGAVIYKSRPWRLATHPLLLSVLAPLAISKIGLFAPASEPVLVKGFDLYRQFLQNRSKPKAK
jgi:hypothetical protein